MLPPIKGFLKNTLLDWEGKLAAIVFLPGCNFRCPYCHARHLILPQASDETIPIASVLTSLRDQTGWIDGVVISGGEPTLHHNLIELIRLFRAEGLQVKLDTNGSRPDVLQELLHLKTLDYVAMDVKAPLDQTYHQVAGVTVDLEALHRSIELLISGDVPYEFRTTVCPGMLDADAIENIARCVRGARLYCLQSFRPVNCLDPSLEHVEPYNPDQMRDLARVAAKYVSRSIVRGDSASELVTAASGRTR